MDYVFCDNSDHFNGIHSNVKRIQIMCLWYTPDSVKIKKDVWVGNKIGDDGDNVYLWVVINFFLYWPIFSKFFPLNIGYRYNSKKKKKPILRDPCTAGIPKLKFWKLT